jgi:glucose dehydrogenase
MQCKPIMQCNPVALKCRGLLAGACFAAFLVAGAAGSAFGADYTPVTDARLANPEPENWLMTRGNYKGWSYSALDQINAHNVKNLVPVWSISTGVDSGHESLISSISTTAADSIWPSSVSLRLTRGAI